MYANATEEVECLAIRSYKFGCGGVLDFFRRGKGGSEHMHSNSTGSEGSTLKFPRDHAAPHPVFIGSWANARGSR